MEGEMAVLCRECASESSLFIIIVGGRMLGEEG